MDYLNTTCWLLIVRRHSAKNFLSSKKDWLPISRFIGCYFVIVEKPYYMVSVILFWWSKLCAWLCNIFLLIMLSATVLFINQYYYGGNTYTIHNTIGIMGGIFLFTLQFTMLEMESSIEMLCTAFVHYLGICCYVSFHLAANCSFLNRYVAIDPYYVFRNDIRNLAIYRS